MNNTDSLSTYFELNRPAIHDIINIYIAILECINSGRDDGVIFHMEYIKYNYRNNKVYMPVKRAWEKVFTPEWLFESMRISLQYADTNVIKIAEDVICTYKSNGCIECLNMLKYYKQRLEKSHRIITSGNVFFVIFVFIVVVFYYRMYGICFY